MKSLLEKPGLLFVLALATGLPLIVGAHGTGASYQAVIQGYTVDIGYSSPAPQEGESVIFDFRLRDKEGNDIPFSDVWTRIESPSGTVFATGIYNAKFGGSRLSYVFPSAGSYTVYARYENDANAIVEGSFPITVVPSATQTSSLPSRAIPYLFGILGLGIGFILTFVVMKRRSITASL